MRRIAVRHVWTLATCAAILCVAAPAWACSVPVFRYALEKWPNDPYQAVLFHRGELTAELEAVAERLGPDGRAGEMFANVEFRAVDVEGIDTTTPQGRIDGQLWQELEAQAVPMPRLVLYYPLSLPISVPVWQGEPTTANADRLINSPIRRQLAERILKGETAVWLLLESGDKAKDDAALAQLEAGLRRAEKEIELPAADPQDVADGLISVDQEALRVRFSTLRLSRENTDEAALVGMLLHSEPDLLDPEYAHEPMAFAVFGRGRALPPWVGKGITEEAALTDGQFLCGACTCQIKGQNPGVDLLTATDWNTLITPQLEVDDTPPPLPTLDGFDPPTEPTGTSVAPMGADQAPTGTESSAGKSAAAVDATEITAADTEATQPIASPAAAKTTAAAASTADLGGLSRVTITILALAGALVLSVAVAGVLMMRRGAE
jgi:hypothetical protein